MKLNRLPGLVGVGILLLGFGSIAAAQTQQDAQPSLGDIVKQKPAKKAVKVITDDDMPQKPAEPPPADQSATEKPKPAAAEAGKQPKEAPAQPDTIKAPDGTVLDTPARRVELARASEAASKAKIEDLKKRRDAATTDAEVADLDAQLQREQNYLAMYTAARQKAEAEAEAAKRSAQQAAPAPAPAPAPVANPPQ